MEREEYIYIRFDKTIKSNFKKVIKRNINYQFNIRLKIFYQSIFLSEKKYH